MISSFVDVKWNNYYLLEELVKQYGVELDYSFEDEYASIYDNFNQRSLFSVTCQHRKEMVHLMFMRTSEIN